MSGASDLLQRHIQTLLTPGEWELLIADNIVWELPFAPALGHPGRLEGRDAVEKHVNWFRGAVENFHFSDIRVYPWADPNGAAGEVRAKGLIKETGREYQREYVFFLRAAGGLSPDLSLRHQVAIVPSCDHCGANIISLLLSGLT